MLGFFSGSCFSSIPERKHEPIKYYISSLNSFLSIFIIVSILCVIRLVIFVLKSLSTLIRSFFIFSVFYQNSYTRFSYYLTKSCAACIFSISIFLSYSNHSLSFYSSNYFNFKDFISCSNFSSRKCNRVFSIFYILGGRLLTYSAS